MAITICSGAGEIISTSRNLRGIHDRCRRLKHAVERVEVIPLRDGGANILIKWIDGSWATTNFADYGVCVKYADGSFFTGAKKIVAPQIALRALS